MRETVMALGAPKPKPERGGASRSHRRQKEAMTEPQTDVVERLSQCLLKADLAWKHDPHWLVAQLGHVRELAQELAVELTACRAEQARLERKSKVDDIAFASMNTAAVEAEAQVATLTAARNEFREIAALFHNALVGAGMGGAFNRRLLDEAVARFDVAEDPQFHDPTDSMTEFQTMKEQRDTLTAALRRLSEYVQHKSTCPQFMAVKLDFGPGWVSSSQSKPCTCGFGAVLRAGSEGAP